VTVPRPQGPVAAALEMTSLPGELGTQIREGLERVEEQLDRAVRQADHLADEVSHHLVRAGGKRVRPLLTLLSAHLGRPDRPEVLDAAAVVELTHLASLYHDDVMDSAPLRRGAPSAHQVWGNTVAILTGDVLFARASTLVAGLGTEAVRIQAATFERLCLGQLRETVGPRPEQDPVDHYLGVLADKTGSLIATSARFGAMFAGCSQDVQSVLVDFGELVGVAFQLSDDVIDLSSDGESSGKTPGTDLREGVPTLPVLLARRAACAGDAQAKEIVELLDGDLGNDAVLAEAVGRLRDHPVTRLARSQAQRRADEAIVALRPLPEGPVKQALVAFADAVVDRTS